MLELSLNQIMKHMGTTLILKDINFAVYENDRVGIIGANGCGKSTILKMIAGIEPLKLFPGSWSPGYDFGWISTPRDASVAYLDQLPSYEEELTVKDVIDKAFEEVFALEEEMRTLEQSMASVEGDAMEGLLKRYGKVSERFESLGGYDVKAKIGRVCTGLGLTEAFLMQSYSQLSGGEKTTVELGKLLIEQPDILLLDEPTNHLDTESIEWLEGYLNKYKGIVMVVSHDRAFLDNVANKILEIEDLTSYMYNGNYSKYKMLKDEKLRVQLDHYREQQKQIESMEKQIRELREWAAKSDNNKFYQRAASIQIKLDKMVRIKKPVFKRRNMRLNLDVNQRSGNEVIKVEGLSKAFDDKVIFQDANLLVRYGERIALLGANGCGKSTFVKMLLNELEPECGNVRVSDSANVAYLPQEIKFKNEEMTVLECFREDVVIEEGKGREYLAKYMFYGKRAYTKVSGLSGGERIRLKLAKLLYDDVNLLILDEPTNHLDVESIETIEEALEGYEGTILFISHDRQFVDKVCDKIIAIEDCKLMEYEGNYRAYRKELSAKAQALQKESESQKASLEESKTEVKPGKGSWKDRKPDLEKKLARLEKKITEVEETVDQIDSEMLLYGDDHLKLEALYASKSEKEDILIAMWEEYEALQA